MVTVSVDNKMNTNETRDALGATWPFLMDAERTLLHELEMVDSTDSHHGEIYIPYTFMLDRDRASTRFTTAGGTSAVLLSKRSAWTSVPS
jgi:peroxiredoxin